MRIEFKVLRRLLRRKASGENGATAVEFAFIVTPLIFMIGSIFELGIIQFTQFQLQNNVQAAASIIRLGPAPAAPGVVVTYVPPLQSELKTEICRQVLFIQNCEAEINLEVVRAASFAALQSLVRSPLSVGPAPVPAYNVGGSNDVGSIIATYDWQFIFPLMAVFSNRTAPDTGYRMTASLIFKNENF